MSNRNRTRGLPPRRWIRLSLMMLACLLPLLLLAVSYAQEEWEINRNICGEACPDCGCDCKDVEYGWNPDFGQWEWWDPHTCWTDTTNYDYVFFVPDGDSSATCQSTEYLVTTRVKEVCDEVCTVSADWGREGIDCDGPHGIYNDEVAYCECVTGSTGG